MRKAEPWACVPGACRTTASGWTPEWESGCLPIEWDGQSLAHAWISGGKGPTGGEAFRAWRRKWNRPPATMAGGPGWSFGGKSGLTCALARLYGEDHVARADVARRVAHAQHQYVSPRPQRPGLEAELLRPAVEQAVGRED